MCRLALKLSGLMEYEEAAGLLEEVGQIAISPSSVWRRVERWGPKAQAVETRQRVQANAAPSRREPIAGEARQAPRQGAAMDGGMVHIRSEGWKELKIGCVFDVELRWERDPETGDWGERAHAVHNRYAAHLGGAETFGQALWSVARAHGWSRAADTIVLGDGAEWIWNLVRDHFYDSRQVVDWYHATQHLAQAAAFLHGDGTPAAHQWRQTYRDSLYQGHAQSLAQALEQAATRHRKIAPDLRREAGYFRTNQRRMQYQELREEGWPIGSGMAESGCKQYRARFAGSGMRWSRKGAERLLPIRTALLSRSFDALWREAYALP